MRALAFTALTAAVLAAVLVFAVPGATAGPSHHPARARAAVAAADAQLATPAYQQALTAASAGATRQALDCWARFNRRYLVRPVTEHGITTFRVKGFSVAQGVLVYDGAQLLSVGLINAAERVAGEEALSPVESTLELNLIADGYKDAAILQGQAEKLALSSTPGCWLLFAQMAKIKAVPVPRGDKSALARAKQQAIKDFHRFANAVERYDLRPANRLWLSILAGEAAHVQAQLPGITLPLPASCELLPAFPSVSGLCSATGSSGTTGGTTAPAST